jgi:hypothetical protein
MIASGTNARVIVYNTVVTWLAPKVNLAPAQIRGRTQVCRTTPGGYGQAKGAFLTMCDEISTTLSACTGGALKLSGAWRIKHQNDVIADFINAVAVALMAAPMTSSGRISLVWAME